MKAPKVPVRLPKPNLLAMSIGAAVGAALVLTLRPEPEQTYADPTPPELRGDPHFVG